MRTADLTIALSEPIERKVRPVARHLLRARPRVATLRKVPVDPALLGGRFTPGIKHAVLIGNLDIPYLDVDLLTDLVCETLPSILRCADFLLLTYHECREQLANPHKMIEYLASGRPVLATMNHWNQMLKVVTRRTPLLQRADIWFFEGDGDVCIMGNNQFYCASHAPDAKTIELNKVYTTTIDLQQTLNEIESKFEKKLRWYVRKGEKGRFSHNVSLPQGDGDIADLVSEYNYFANRKALDILQREWLLNYVDGKTTIITNLSDGTRIILYHVYINDGARVRLQFSFSTNYATGLDGQYLGTANRYLHWMDIQHFKRTGFHVYDLGGIPEASSDLLSLRRFKLTFGGEIEQSWDFRIEKGVFRAIKKLIRGKST